MLYKQKQHVHNLLEKRTIVNLLSILIVIIPNSKGQIQNNQAVIPFLGKFHFMFAWPEPEEGLSNCTTTKFKSMKMKLEEPLTCKCERSTNLGVLRMSYKLYDDSLSSMLLAQIVESLRDFETARNNNCYCEPYMNLVQSVFLQLSLDCFLFTVTSSLKKNTYILCKNIQQDVGSLLTIWKNLKEDEGQIMCERHIKGDEYMTSTELTTKTRRHVIYDRFEHVKHGWLRNKKLLENKEFSKLDKQTIMRNQILGSAVTLY